MDQTICLTGGLAMLYSGIIHRNIEIIHAGIQWINDLKKWNHHIDVPVMSGISLSQIKVRLNKFSSIRWKFQAPSNPFVTQSFHPSSPSLHMSASNFTSWAGSRGLVWACSWCRESASSRSWQGYWHSTRTRRPPCGWLWWASTWSRGSRHTVPSPYTAPARTMSPWWSYARSNTLKYQQSIWQYLHIQVIHFRDVMIYHTCISYILVIATITCFIQST